MLAVMNLNSRITFTNKGEVVLVMDQTANTPKGELFRSFVFTLRSGDGRMLGTLAPELTQGHGYARAIGHVGKALLQIFPHLQLEIDSFPSYSSSSTFKWTTSEIEDCVDKQLRYDM